MQEMNWGSGPLCPWGPRRQPPILPTRQSPLQDSYIPMALTSKTTASPAPAPALYPLPQVCQLSPGTWRGGINPPWPTAQPQPNHSSCSVPAALAPVSVALALAFTLLAGVALLPLTPSP